MALTDKQKHSVIFFLGWPSKTLDVGSTHFSKIVTDRLNLVSVNGEIRVAELLCKVESIRSQLDDAQCRLATSSVDKLVLRKDEVGRLKSLEKHWLCLLKDLTDIPLMKSCSSNVSMVV